MLAGRSQPLEADIQRGELSAVLQCRRQQDGVGNLAEALESVTYGPGQVNHRPIQGPKSMPTQSSQVDQDFDGVQRGDRVPDNRRIARHSNEAASVNVQVAQPSSGRPSNHALAAAWWT